MLYQDFFWLTSCGNWCSPHFEWWVLFVHWLVQQLQICTLVYILKEGGKPCWYGKKNPSKQWGKPLQAPEVIMVSDAENVNSCEKGKHLGLLCGLEAFLYLIWLELNSLLPLKMSNLIECKTCFSLNPKHHRLVFFLNDQKKHWDFYSSEKFLGKQHLHANICLHENRCLKSARKPLYFIIENVFYYIFMGFS